MVADQGNDVSENVIFYLLTALSFDENITRHVWFGISDKSSHEYNSKTHESKIK